MKKENEKDLSEASISGDETEYLPNNDEQKPLNDVKPKKKKILAIVIAAVLIIAAVIVIIVVSSRPKYGQVSFSSSEIHAEVGHSGTYDKFELEPEDAVFPEIISWESSDESIATVTNDGVITPKKEGDCTITIKCKGGGTASVTLKVGPDTTSFKYLYDKYCASSFATLASDRSYLAIDTRPKDKYGSTDDDALAAIVKVNRALGLPDSVLERMSSTRAIDGKQTETHKGITVSWSYHPDNGLEVIYSRD